MIADQAQSWLTNFHEIPTIKGGDFSQQTTSPSPLHAPTILTFRRATQNVREDLVKVPEVRKRAACYHR
jgi:hypothetical protein